MSWSNKNKQILKIKRLEFKRKTSNWPHELENIYINFSSFFRHITETIIRESFPLISYHHQYKYWLSLIKFLSSCETFFHYSIFIVFFSFIKNISKLCTAFWEMFCLSTRRQSYECFIRSSSISLIIFFFFFSVKSSLFLVSGSISNQIIICPKENSTWAIFIQFRGRGRGKFGNFNLRADKIEFNFKT